MDLWEGKEEFPWEEYRAAREFVRSLGLEDRDEWDALIKEGIPEGERIPPDPERVYHNRGWTGWNDWLGIEEPAEPGEGPRKTLFPADPPGDLWSAGESTKWMNFHEARRLAREYGFEYEEEWELFTRGKFPGRKPLPENVPVHPDRVYSHLGWKGWRDWLVSPDSQVEYSPFPWAREFVRSCRIPGMDAWRDFLRENGAVIREHRMTLPERPHLEYRDTGWKGWEDWLGTGIPFRDFRTTRKFVRSLKLKDEKHWFDYCLGRLPNRPARSEKVYTFPDVAFRDEGWAGWGDWLGMAQDGDAAPETREITIECRCKGRNPDCPDCDGKGFYTVRLD